MLRVGLTGSIGMGKSTTAQMFREAGVPVLDSDQIVHDLYRGAAVAPIETAFPGVTVDGVVNRGRLAAQVLADPHALKRLEAIVHPLVWAARDDFLKEQEKKGASIIVYDVPLLFETGAEKSVDAIVVVTAPEDVQKARVLARPGMTEEKFAAILAKQIPDAEKRARADFIVHTEKGMDAARREVQAVLDELERRR
ncbi:dephospho-CoA kinase [Methylocystis sp. MJC1]|jgi:dephospho-CoA kinase|uniref:dephospho-CoA kinase n=1 Tax=Methylocystis sp. MJC1 TaxID=2654282 RepID=UPI0013EA3050|nr:dephospho-CoA kinase [Methylocystis sp. MJC1]KAF2991881.1 Dephospho-CoA kinase [Methylocystis sp. MJC1]MBU6528984.1 dephospho-CoA kinase [Methylocystis sp. MJC1]UZX13808.1 dephospho-CoA kinase [Methylocystis sp. MJC1]